MTGTATLLQALHRLAHRTWRDRAAELALSFSEFEYLAAVQAEAATQYSGEDVHGQHLHNVVDRLGVSKASASAMVSKLETRGLITRIACQMDARAQHIILTEAGADLLAQGEALYETIAEALSADMKAQAQATLP